MERRAYQRISSGAMGAFFIRENGQLLYDFSGTIDNVSETGLCVLVGARDYDNLDDFLEIGRSITFQAIDENGFSIHKAKGTFDGSMHIVRKALKDNELLVGCRMDGRSESFQQYVENKKVYHFMKAMNRA